MSYLPLSQQLEIFADFAKKISYRKKLPEGDVNGIAANKLERIAELCLMIAPLVSAADNFLDGKTSEEQFIKKALIPRGILSGLSKKDRV